MIPTSVLFGINTITRRYKRKLFSIPKNEFIVKTCALRWDAYGLGFILNVPSTTMIEESKRDTRSSSVAKINIGPQFIPVSLSMKSSHANRNGFHFLVI